MTYPHTLCDAFGISLFLRAWACMIGDQEHLVPPLQASDKDHLAVISTQPENEHFLLADIMLTGLRLVLFIIAYRFEPFWWRKDETNVILLPNANVHAMKQETL